MEKTTADQSLKDRQINKLENQNQNLTAQIASKDKTINEIRNEISSEKGELNDKLDQLRVKQQETLDELSQKKIEFERDRALKTQQLQFQDQRISELSKQLEETIRRYDERQKQDREELQKDMQEKVYRVT